MLKKVEYEFLINNRVEKMVKFLIVEHSINIIEAFRLVYNSRTYQLLINLNTGLYYESPEYIYYNYLENELFPEKVINDIVAEPNSDYSIEKTL